MSYSKTTWETGDTITAQLLNHAEDGIAANDAAIAALPEGLQLYGPYFARNSDATVEAGKAAAIELETLEDINGISVTYPQSTDAIIIPYNFSASSVANCVVQDMYPPYVAQGTWGAATLIVFNTGALDSIGTATIGFYSTVEFPQDSQES